MGLEEVGLYKPFVGKGLVPAPPMLSGHALGSAAYKRKHGSRVHVPSMNLPANFQNSPHGFPNKRPETMRLPLPRDQVVFHTAAL